MPGVLRKQCLCCITSQFKKMFFKVWHGFERFVKAESVCLHFTDYYYNHFNKTEHCGRGCCGVLWCPCPVLHLLCFQCRRHQSGLYLFEPDVHLTSHLTLSTDLTDLRRRRRKDTCVWAAIKDGYHGSIRNQASASGDKLIREQSPTQNKNNCSRNTHTQYEVRQGNGEYMWGLHKTLHFITVETEFSV